MLGSGGQGIMRFDVTYGVFVNHVYCVFQPCDVVQFVSSTELYVCTAFSPSPSLPSLVDSVSIGLVSISTDLVCVTVSVVFSRLVLRPRATTHSNRHHPQAHLLVMSLMVGG